MEEKDIEKRIRDLGESLGYKSGTDFAAAGLAEMEKMKVKRRTRKRAVWFRSLATTVALLLIVAIPIVVNSYINKEGYQDDGPPPEVIADAGFKNLDEFNYIQGKSYKGFSAEGFDTNELVVFKNVENGRPVYLKQHTSISTDVKIVDNILFIVLFKNYKNDEIKTCRQNCTKTMTLGGVEVKYGQAVEELEEGLVFYHSYAMWTNDNIQYYFWQDALSADDFLEQLGKLFV